MIQLNIVTTSEKKARQRDSKKAKKEAMEDNVEVKKTEEEIMVDTNNVEKDEDTTTNIIRLHHIATEKPHQIKSIV